MKCFNCGATKSFEEVSGDVDVQDLVSGDVDVQDLAVSRWGDSPSHKCKCGSYAYNQTAAYVFDVAYYEEVLCKGVVTVQARDEAEAKRQLINADYSGLVETSRSLPKFSRTPSVTLNEVVQVEDDSWIYT